MAGQDAPLEQKLREYRELAAKARAAAAKATSPDIKRSQEDLAQAWEQLIAELQALDKR